MNLPQFPGSAGRVFRRTGRQDDNSSFFEKTIRSSESYTTASTCDDSYFTLQFHECILLLVYLIIYTRFERFLTRKPYFLRLIIVSMWLYIIRKTKTFIASDRISGKRT